MKRAIKLCSECYGAHRIHGRVTYTNKDGQQDILDCLSAPGYVENFGECYSCNPDAAAIDAVGV